MACHRSGYIAIRAAVTDMLSDLASTHAEAEALERRFYSKEAKSDRSTIINSARRDLFTHIRAGEQKLVLQYGITLGQARSLATYPYGWF